MDQISHEQSSDIVEIIHVDNKQFQLRTIIGSRLLGNNANWRGHIYSRHGRSFIGWWFNDSDMQIPIQLDNLPEILPYNDNYTCVYVCTENDDIVTLRHKFLESLGGQSHVQCSKHKLPLIASSTRSNKCQCGKTEFYRCCELSCNTFMCKKCFQSTNKNITIYLNPTETVHNEDLDNSDYESDDELIEPYRINEVDNDANGSLIDDNWDEDDDMEMFNEEVYGENGCTQKNDELDLLTRSLDSDIPISNVDDICLDDQNLSNMIPTTNVGEIAHCVEQTTIYGGSQGKLTISGHVLLNQCGSLLTRQKHELKGSSKHHFFLQKIVATSNGSSIPLMYPEGILFPSIHWKMANDNCSILGCIPAPLLSDSIESYGFASIRSHIKNRVTNVSSSTSTNTNYISHCYDMLNNIAANREDTMVILNRGLTVDKNSKSGLCLR